MYLHGCICMGHLHMCICADVSAWVYWYWQICSGGFAWANLHCRVYTCTSAPVYLHMFICLCICTGQAVQVYITPPSYLAGHVLSYRWQLCRHFLMHISDEKTPQEHSLKARKNLAQNDWKSGGDWSLSLKSPMRLLQILSTQTFLA